MIRLIQLNYTCKARNNIDKKDDMFLERVIFFLSKRVSVLVMRNYLSEAVFLRYAPGVV